MLIALRPAELLSREADHLLQPVRHFGEMGHLIVHSPSSRPDISDLGKPYVNLNDRNEFRFRSSANRAGALAVVAMGGATETGSPIHRPETAPLISGTDKHLPPRSIKNRKLDPTNPLSSVVANLVFL